MIPGMDPKMLKQAMKKLGMKQEEIDASEVIIKCSDKNIIIKNPEVLKVNMQGSENFQISGEISEENNEEDLKMIMEQSSASKEDAEKALDEANGDIAEAILKLNS
jgi:nascent polypeptide-associated complex subunit alpha